MLNLFARIDTDESVAREHSARWSTAQRAIPWRRAASRKIEKRFARVGRRTGVSCWPRDDLRNRSGAAGVRVGARVEMAESSPWGRRRWSRNPTGKLGVCAGSRARAQSPAAQPQKRDRIQAPFWSHFDDAL